MQDRRATSDNTCSCLACQATAEKNHAAQWAILARGNEQLKRLREETVRDHADDTPSRCA